MAATFSNPRFCTEYRSFVDSLIVAKKVLRANIYQTEVIRQIVMGEDGVRSVNGSHRLQNIHVLYRRWLNFIHYESMIELKPRTLGFIVTPGFEYF